MTARIIEFSGGDGSGKTTALNYFCDQLEKHGKKVLRTREVGSPHIPVCSKLREIVLDPKASLDGRTMEFVFAAMRIENQKFYESVKDQYDFIVSDRGWLCHLAYTDHNVSPEFTDQLYYSLLSQHTTLPDEIFLFQVDPEVSKTRRTKRGDPVDAIEAKGPEFQVKVLASYLGHANHIYQVNHTNKYVGVHVIDANQSIEGVRKNMDTYVEALCSR